MLYNLHMSKSLPDFSYELKLWKKYKVVAGMDEVGRGCFAGPVVAGVVVFHPGTEVNWVVINDSKKLSSKAREIADKWIRSNCLSHGIGAATVTQINKFGIKKATDIAFRKAIANCNKQIEFLLIDAFYRRSRASFAYVPYTRSLPRKKQLGIFKGDSKVISIAAASIIAKVYRDNLMERLSENPKYKKYLWHQNKGYGTSLHRDAIKDHGITRHHRKLFVRNIRD